MFTGIIEEVGKVKSITRGSRSILLEVEAGRVLEGTKLGDSIATNGVCLTVTSLSDRGFKADVMPETMQRSNLGLLKPGSAVNLERALCLNSRLGGHLVAGHVDGTGRILDREQDDNAVWITIGTSARILRYVLEKGSVAIDGISLTVAYVDEAVFKVSVIPHTLQQTTLAQKRVGEVVNLENDMIARYVEKLLGKEKDDFSLDFLKDNGF